MWGFAFGTASILMAIVLGFFLIALCIAFPLVAVPCLVATGLVIKYLLTPEGRNK